MEILHNIYGIFQDNLRAEKIKLPLKQISSEYQYYRYLVEIYCLPESILNFLEQKNTKEKSFRHHLLYKYIFREIYI